MRKHFILAVVALFALASCKKEVTRVSNSASGIEATISPDAWAANDDSTYFSASFDVPELTKAIYDHGAVMVYLSFGNDIFEALPEVYNGIAFGAIHSVGAVTVDMSDVDGNYKILPPDGDVIAKIVLIDAQKLAKHPDVNLLDYNEVKKVFH